MARPVSRQVVTDRWVTRLLILDTVHEVSGKCNEKKNPDLYGAVNVSKVILPTVVNRFTTGGGNNAIIYTL
jgi:hypothetical protein